MVIFLILSLLVGCNGDTEGDATSNEAALENGEVETPKEPVIVILEGGDAGFPSPFGHLPRMRGTVMKYVFDSLLEPDEDQCIPWLAEKWEISEDGKTHDITIREGVKWHDGEKMTANDVVFSFQYYLEHPPVFIGEVITQSGYIQEIEAVNDYQVKIVTSEPNSTFYCEAGMLRIIPEHIWKDVDDPYGFTDEGSVIGCGPFILTDYSKEHGTYRYEAFEDYWGPKQRVDVIEMVPVSDEILAFEGGDISIARITTDLLGRFENNEEFFILESPALAGTMISFNMNKNDLFKKKEFRQAFTYSIDKEDIIQKIQRGAAKPGSPGILPIDHQWYNSNLQKYDYNPEKALELLKEAGVEGSLSFELLVSEGAEVRVGELLKEQLAKVNIDLTVVAVDNQSRDARANEGNYEIAILSMGAWGLDADYLRTRYYSELEEGAGGSATGILGSDQGYVNPEVDRLCEDQLKETDREKRKQIIYNLQEVLAEDCPEIPLYNNYYIYVFRPDEYDGWTFMFDHAVMTHAKLSFLEK
ncbi:diguanylate phosphodiesterase [Candidatus Contubernalis alkalaceticus]|nr:diguanylate phosphodiesterase [Candidatus Contubernalis alkalaceticus]